MNDVQKSKWKNWVETNQKVLQELLKAELLKVNKRNRNYVLLNTNTISFLHWKSNFINHVKKFLQLEYQWNQIIFTLNINSRTYPRKNATVTFVTIKSIISNVTSLSLLKLLITKIIFIQQTIKVALKSFKDCKEEDSKKI